MASPTPKTGTSASFALDEPTKASTTYQTRALHTDGHILITASASGTIRVFRQDCAVAKRAKMLALDPSARRAYLRRAFGATPSSQSSTGPNSARPGSVHSFKMMGGGPSGGGGGRTPSGRSKTETRLSMTLGGSLAGGEMVARPRRAESAASSMIPGRERIERWREDIDGPRRESAVSSFARTESAGRAPSLGSATSVSMVTANESPARPRGTPASGAADVGNGAPAPAEVAPASPVRPAAPRAANGVDEAPEGAARRRASSFANPLRMQGGQSFMFWNTSQYARKGKDGENRPAADTRVSQQSAVSKLTSEESGEESGEDEDEADDQGEMALHLRQCPRCGGNEFNVKETRGWSLGKVKSVVCQDCGLERKDNG